jgi:hypothetical protein
MGCTGVVGWAVHDVSMDGCTWQERHMWAGGFGRLAGNLDLEIRINAIGMALIQHSDGVF